MKTTSLVFFAFLSLFLFSGCGSNGADPLAQDAQAEDAAAPARPAREPDVMGIITSVVGNEVTIMKLDASKMRFGRPATDQGERPSGTEANSAGLNPSAALGNTGGGVVHGTGMGPGMGMGPGGGGSSGSFDREAMQAQRDKMLEEMKKNSLGSEKVIIPVGIPLLHGGRPGQEAQVSFSEIKKDSLITLWLNQEVTDKKVAEFAVLMGGGMAGSRPEQN